MKKTFLFLLLSLTIFSTSARLLSVKATLNGTSVVPANSSTHFGTLTGTFDDVTNFFSWTLTFSMSPITGYSFNQASVGVNGSAFLSSSAVPSPASGASPPLSNPIIADLLAGNVYVVILTSTFPSGEIRGQLAVGMEIFSISTMNDFYGIGGYSYTEGTFPANNLITSPYVRSSPLPNNDFTFVATSPLNLFGFQDKLTTVAQNQPITLTFKGNNVRKMRSFVREEDINGVALNGNISATATTNLGNAATVTAGLSSSSVGFRVLNENEYITQVVFSAPSNGQYTTLDNIMIGDDTPQNVSLDLDGVDDHITLPSNVGNFAANVAFTITAWVNPAATQASLSNPDNDILEKWDGISSTYPFVIRYLNSGVDAGKIQASRYDGNPAHSVSLVSDGSLNDGKWHHIAYVRELGVLKLYVDGLLNDSDADLVVNSTTNTSPLSIGSRNTINHFKGKIDEVRIWSVAKNATEILNEMFCKTPNPTNLQAAYNFSEGVPNGNNSLLSQVNSLVNNGTSAGTLNNFAKTGDASNFVTGQVKYVKPGVVGNGSSWANAFFDLQSALVANTCNDLFDVYVATGKYKPHTSNKNSSFDIPAGMKIYGGFAGTEKNINQRDMALIHSTYETTLSGDLDNNDTPFVFDFNFNNNSYTVVNINGSYVTFDGFTVNGGQIRGIYKEAFGDVTISNCKIVSNVEGLYLNQANSKVSNCIVAGNYFEGIENNNNSTNYQNCLIVNNGGSGISQISDNNIQSNFTNCTIASNGNLGIENQAPDHFSRITNNIKNTIIKDNGSGGIANIGFGITNNNITYSLVQGETSTTNGNLNGNTVNPQFVSPLANTVQSDAGDYRLKWCSLAIGAGNNTGISPLDLDRKPRRYRTNVDMGAYEHMGNTPTGANPIDITYTIDIPNYSGVGVQRITSAAKILAPAGTVNFTAPNSITLNPGFEARGVGKYFKAQIGANVSCSN